MNIVQRRWGILWNSKNRLDGVSRHLMWNHGPTPLVFKTRHEAREYRDERWGYIRTRKDLRIEPHGWRLPKVVRVMMTYEIVE